MNAEFGSEFRVHHSCFRVLYTAMSDNDCAFGIRPRRLGLVMEPNPRDLNEAMGVLNPASARGRDGRLYLFPRVVGPDNFSRVGLARVVFDTGGDPIGVERMGYVLEPEQPYELHGHTGGCEDPRITYFEPFGLYVMVYAAWGPEGPRVAMACSEDLRHWRRTGLVDFVSDADPSYPVDFDAYHNKDGIIFPKPILDPEGRPSVALLHRPVYQTAGETTHDLPPGVTDPMPSIWISYSPLDELNGRFPNRTRFYHHHLVMDPDYDWEALRIGAGPPPILTENGWLLIHHGVSDILDPMLSADEPDEMRSAAIIGPGAVERKNLSYRVGFALLDRDDPRKVLCRSERPIMEPHGAVETSGIVSNVVFPTALDVRDDIGQPKRVDMYYGAADTRIAAATFTLPF